jgi:hypothetical protein
MLVGAGNFGLENKKIGLGGWGGLGVLSLPLTSTPLRYRGKGAVIYRGRLTLRNIWGTRSLGARTSGPHEALPYLEEMRTGGLSVPRRAGRYSILTGAVAQEESPILTACYTPNQSKNLYLYTSEV